MTDTPARLLLVLLPPRRDWPGGGRLPLAGTLPLRALAFDDDGVREASCTLATLPRARSLDLVFDPLDVFTGSVQAPRLDAPRMARALPGLLEDRLLADPADCHFAWRVQGADAPAPAPAATTQTPPAPPLAPAAQLAVAAADRVALERAVEALAAQRRSARAAYALTALLPPPAEATGAVCVHQGRMHLNYGGGALTCELLPGAVSGIELAKRPAGLRGLRLHGPAKPDEQSALAALAAGASLALEFAPGAPAGWGDPGDPLDRADTVNLLQGDFARPAGVGHLLAWLAQASANGAWRAPAAWTLAIVLVSLAGLNAYWWKLESQAGALRSAMQRSFREALPQEHAVIDELAQAQRAVQALRLRAGQPSPGDFGVLNAAAARLLAQVPAGAVRNLEYASGTLKVGVRAGTLDDGALRGRLQTAALAAGLVFAVEGPETLRLSANGEGP